MDTGTKISGIAHLIAIGWVLFGVAHEPEPLPFEVQDVSMISAQDFAAMTASRQPPDVKDQPAGLTQPETPVETPVLSTNTDVQPSQAEPDPAPQPKTENAPETVPDAPAPETETVDTPPEMPVPDPEVAVLTPLPPTQPMSRPVDRVAPQPVAPPPPDAKPDPVDRPEIAPEAGADTPQTPQEATAPEEATDRIVTEANKGEDLAPARSVRPRVRPKRQATVRETPTDTRRAVNDALAEALGGAAQAPAPSGPPLTSGEKEALRVAVSTCWNVGSLSSAALATTVVV